MTISAGIGVVRTVTSRDLHQVERLLAEDPVATCFVTSRVKVGGVDPWRLGGELVGYFDDDVLASMVYAGANLVPVCTTPASRAALADRLRSRGRRRSGRSRPGSANVDSLPRSRGPGCRRR